MNERGDESVTRHATPYVSLGLFLMMAMAFGIFWVLNLGTPGAENDFGTRFTPVVLMLDGLVFTSVGAIITSRRPENGIGQVCLLIGLLIGVNSLAGEYGVYALLTEPGALPGGDIAAWFVNWTWVVYIGLIGTVLVLVFPDGRLPSRRWRPVIALALVAMAMVAVSFALAPGPFLSVPWAADNPFGVEGAAFVLELFSLLGFFLLATTFVAAAWSMVIRFRLARGRLRQQIKWFASAAGLFVVVYVGQAFYSLMTGTLSASTDVQRGIQTLAAATFGILAAAVGLAVMRFRLYEIDHVISRTFSYGAITGILLGVYLLLIFVLGSVLPFEGDLAVAASTLAVAAMFNPVRRRTQAAVDRRFNRSRYDAIHTVGLFAQRLRDEVGLEELTDELSAVVDTTMQPRHLSLWLRDEAGES
ncbi:hypothetical protein BH23ACT5_BH23ACT5_17290 [soil metagenome]